MPEEISTMAQQGRVRGTVAESTTFRLDYDQPEFPGWTRRESWNGWGCPYFERASADQAMAFVNRQADTDEEMVSVVYEAEYDSYIIRYSDLDGDSRIMRGQDIETTLGVRHVYALGAEEWCWLERGIHFDR